VKGRGDGFVLVDGGGCATMGGGGSPVCKDNRGGLTEVEQRHFFYGRSRRRSSSQSLGAGLCACSCASRSQYGKTVWEGWLGRVGKDLVLKHVRTKVS
jgi:hypothetical protein